MSTKLPALTSATTGSATTLGPQAVRTITVSGDLLMKTARVVISETATGYELRVIRASSTSLGQMSCEVYLRASGATEWGSVREIKGPKLPPTVYEPPPGATRDEIDGIECYTVLPMTDEERERLRALIAPTRADDQG